MTPQITPRDLELISAYLDNQLNAKEQVWLDSRMRENPALQTAMEDMGKLRAFLRAQPRTRAPRNFTLTPSMAGKTAHGRASSDAYPLFRLASALATLFFVIITAGGLVLQKTMPAQMLVMRTEQQDFAQPAPFGMGGGGGGGGGAEGPFEQPRPLAAMPTAGAMEKTAPEEPPEAEVQMLPVTPPAPQDTATPAEGANAVGVMAEPESAMPTVVEGAPQAIPSQIAPSERQSSAAFAWQVLTVLQILLAILAVAAGAAALFLRRSARR